MKQAYITITLETIEDQQVPYIFTNWAVFMNGEFVFHTILNKNMVKSCFQENKLWSF